MTVMCDSLCGGAGCGFCGGLSCESGATTKVERAFSFAKEGEKYIRDKESKAEELYRGVSIHITHIVFDFFVFFFSADISRQSRIECNVIQR